MTTSRRSFLQLGAAAALAAPTLVPSAWAAQDIKLGSLLDLSGNFDAYG
ncbi:MAG: twin-arginine translocation signal domain-containing protein, partial [Comamonadaceae bacterium]